jgi:transposase
MRHREGTILESLATLQRLERRYRHKPQELRLKALRLLQEDPSLTLQEVAALLGRSYRTLQRWWSTYRRQGLTKLLQVSQGGGQKPVKIGEAGLKQLQQRLQTDGFADLKEIQRFLKERFGKSYSISGVWYLVRVKLKAKLKTGRPRSVHQDPKAVEAFKKTVWRRWRIGRYGPKMRRVWA